MTKQRRVAMRLFLFSPIRDDAFVYVVGDKRLGTPGLKKPMRGRGSKST